MRVVHFVDIAIIIAFLIATLYIGFSSGKKIKTFSDYAIGNRRFSDFAICCTVAATIIGGSATIGEVGMVYNVGIIQFLSQFGELMAYFVVGTFIARRFSLYYGCYSLGDIFFKAYGPTGKVLAGFLGWIFEIFLVSLQFAALGTTINILTGLSYQISLFISAGIILIYTGRGGIRAVTFTDVLQFIVLIVAFPILLISVLGDIGGFHALIERLPKTHTTIMNEHLPRYLFLMLYIIPSLGPHDIQRLLMMKSGKQGVKAYRNVTLICLFLAIVISFLGLAAKVLLPDLEQSDDALLVLFTNYLPAGVFGVAVIGILSVLMSTADSGLNTGSIMLINDIIIPYHKCIKKKDLSESEQLKYTHVISVIMGIGAIIFASLRMGIFELGVLMEGFWVSTILVLFYFLVFNRKLLFKHFILSVIIGVCFFVFWENIMQPITGVDSIFPVFIVNFIVVLFFYILGGRQKVFSKEELAKIRLAEAGQEIQQASARELQTGNNRLLGICLVFLQLMPLLFDLISLTYSKLLLVLVNGTMAIFLIFGGSLEIFAKEKNFQWLKLLTLFFCLPITSAYLFLSSGGNILHIVTLLLSFIIMLSSVEKRHEGKTAFVCILTAFLTTIIYYILDCHLFWPETFAWQHSFYLFGFLAVLFLIRSNLNTLHRIKEYELAIYRERYTMARSLSHDLSAPLVSLRLLIERNKNGTFNEEEYEFLRNISNEVVSYIDNFVAGTLKEKEPLKPENLNECIINCIEKQKILNKAVEIKLQAEETLLSCINPVLFRRIINNLLNVCVHALPNGCHTIIISIEPDECGNSRILLQAAKGSFSAKAINEMFIEEQTLGDEIHFGISFPEFQAIVEKWHGRLDIITNEDAAMLQILLPNKDEKELKK